MSTASNDSFQLFDLRVEVVCPPGERILCGAKEGDHFTVQGEMLHLPSSQGISIYSLGKRLELSSMFRMLIKSIDSRCVALVGSETAADSYIRLDVDGCIYRMSRSKL